MYLSFVLLSLAVQTVGITFIRREFHADAFALTSLPPMVAGVLLGKRWGALIGITANLLTLGVQIAFGVALKLILSQMLVGTPLAVVAGVGFGYLRDISIRSKIVDRKQKNEAIKRRQLEEQLQQSQKMEAIGTLAGGVAHDMNNILGIIMSSASVLKANGTYGSLNPDVDNILSACKRGRDLTRNLLGFARKGTYIKEVIDINDLIAKSEKLLTPLIDKNTRIETRLARSLHRTYGDRSQIGMALMNICLNAAEAIEGSGRVIISTWNHATTDSRLIRHRLSNGDYVVMQVQDTGKGMDKQTKDHVFEPFFTTKQPGHGTGLGLSMAYGTVKNHGGAIELDSDPGRGTTVTILLPAFKAKGRHEPTPSQLVIPSGRGSILLVDDEPLILTSNQRLLKRLGYDVILAENGHQAIEAYRSAKDPIGLVILDFIMPEMDGAETFVELRKIDPNANIIISSGYSMDGKIEAILKGGARGFIQKPFEMDQLYRLLREISKKGKEN